MTETDADWPEKAEDWRCNQFAVFSHPQEGQVAFLKRVLTLVEELGDVDILDFSVSWYWTRDTPDGLLERRGEVGVYFTQNAAP